MMHNSTRSICRLETWCARWGVARARASLMPPGSCRSFNICLAAVLASSLHPTRNASLPRCHRSLCTGSDGAISATFTTPSAKNRGRPSNGKTPSSHRRTGRTASASTTAAYARSSARTAREPAMVSRLTIFLSTRRSSWNTRS